jgi:rod shape determining protein RodA
MLLFQITINIGMTIGLAPITGIPLPFMSFGGSHTLTNLLAIGVLQAIHVHAQTADEPRLALA